jgi:hypothetical protein
MGEEPEAALSPVILPSEPPGPPTGRLSLFSGAPSAHLSSALSTDG